MPADSEVKNGMLSIHSTVQEMLRALYFYGSNYIMILLEGKERLLHKDQLVALLEQGRAAAALEDMMSVTLAEPLAAKVAIEDIPQESALLIFADGELSGTTFEKYREEKIRESQIILPEWWDVPLPLLNIRNDRVSLNKKALELIPDGVKALSRQLERVKKDKILVIRGKKKSRTFSLSLLERETYFIEDISEDFEMAEDLVWWAAIGKAFVRRMESNGLTVRRISQYETPPGDAAEIIACSWEGELMGNLAIDLPKTGGTEGGAEAKAANSGKDQRAEKTRRQTNKSTAEAKKDTLGTIDEVGQAESGEGSKATPDSAEKALEAAANAPEPSDTAVSQAEKTKKTKDLKPDGIPAQPAPAKKKTVRRANSGAAQPADSAQVDKPAPARTKRKSGIKR
jgi:hypothetical protein